MKKTKSTPFSFGGKLNLCHQGKSWRKITSRGPIDQVIIQAAGGEPRNIEGVQKEKKINASLGGKGHRGRRVRIGEEKRKVHFLGMSA